MAEVSVYRAKTLLPRLICAVERGESVVITRHGRPVARLVPIEDQRRAEVAAAIERIKRARARRPGVTVEEILSARDEGRES